LHYQSALEPSSAAASSAASSVSSAASASDLIDNSDVNESSSVISYPAPLPVFPQVIEDALKSQSKKDVLLIYGEIITESARFYCPMMPTDSGLAKQAFDYIGRTLTEKYPVLAVPEAKVKWSYFNGKLSSALRNMRCRIKRKLHGPSSDTKAKKQYIASVSDNALVITPAKKLSHEAYMAKVERIKTENAKEKSDQQHLKLLLHETFVNRREWINSKPSTELPLKEILNIYPCFHNSEFILNELWMSLGENKENSFKGNCTTQYTLCLL